MPVTGHNVTLTPKQHAVKMEGMTRDDACKWLQVDTGLCDRTVWKWMAGGNVSNGNRFLLESAARSDSAVVDALPGEIRAALRGKS